MSDNRCSPPITLGTSVLAAMLVLLTVEGGVAGATEHPAWVWTDRSGSVAPPPSAGTMVAYDPVADRLVFFGGWNGSTLNETWEYNPTTSIWTELHPAVSPISRADATLVFDPSANEFILFGGWTQYANGSVERLDDTWTFSLANLQWTPRHPVGSPSPRSDSAAAYDPAAGRIYLYGGFSGTSYLGDSWTFDPTTTAWSPVPPIGPTPGIRSDGRMVYDPSVDEFVLFGGNDYNGPNLTFHHLNDTWTYRLTTNEWSLVPTPVAPGSRDYSAEGFDPATGTVLLFSGYGNRTILDDTWSFSIGTNSWTELSPTTSPPGRYAGGGAFDTEDGRLLIVGGLGNAGLLSDTWSLGPASVPASGGGVPLVVVAAFVLVGVLLTGVAARVMVVTHTGPSGRSAAVSPDPGRS